MSFLCRALFCTAINFRSNSLIPWRAVVALLAPFILTLFLLSGGEAAQANDERLTEALTLYSIQNYAPALVTLQLLAKEGNASAQTRLGALYAAGEGVAPNVAEARKWLEAAALQNSTEAIIDLTNLIWSQPKTSTDYQYLRYWLERATDLNIPEAYGMLGELFLYQTDIAPNYPTAIVWLQRGAVNVDPVSFYLLGMCHSIGLGVRQSNIEAYKWFDLAHRAAADELYEPALRAFLSVRERMTPMEVALAVQSTEAWINSQAINVRSTSVASIP